MNTRLEELDNKLAALGDPSEARVDLLIEIAGELVSGDDPQRMITIASEARTLSEKLQYREGEAYSLLFQGVGCCFVAEHEKGLQSVDRSKSIFEKLGHEDGVAKTTFMQANLLRSIGSFDEALANFYKALDHFRARQDTYWEANCLYDLGLLYQEIRDHKKARDSFEATVKTLENFPVSWLHGRALNGLGNSLRNMGDYEQALEYNHRGLSIFQEIGHRMGEARALDDIGAIHYDTGDPDMALPFHQKSLEIRQAIGQRRAQSTSLLNIGRVHLHRRDAKAAFDALREAVEIATETKAKPQIYEAHQLLSQASELEGDSDGALRHHKEFQRIKEEVFNDRATDRMHKLQIGFEVQHAEKEAEIARLKNVELRQKNERLEQLLKELQEAQSQLVQAEKMAALGKLVAGLVHEINTPLGAGNSAIDVADRCMKKMQHLQDSCDSLVDLCSSGKLQSLLERVQENHRVARSANDRITKIVSNLKSFSRLDGGERQRADLHEGLESTLALLEHQWKDRIEIARNYGAIPSVDCYPGEINQIFMTVLSNAVESIIGEGSITIETSAANGKVRIEITDTGGGIPKDRLKHVFDSGFSAKGSRVKAGMGLLVSLNIAHKHGGGIDAESEVGKGSRFTITLPAD